MSEVAAQGMVFPSIFLQFKYSLISQCLQVLGKIGPAFGLPVSACSKFSLVLILSSLHSLLLASFLSLPPPFNGVDILELVAPLFPAHFSSKQLWED